MARVHLFTSQTPYNKRRSPSQEAEFLNNEEATKITLPDELDVDAVPSSPATSTSRSPSSSSSSLRKDNNNNSANNNNNNIQLNNDNTVNNNAALAAALLQNTHSSLDVVEAVAAALAVKPGRVHISTCFNTINLVLTNI
jgi:hypothetical protein